MRIDAQINFTVSGSEATGGVIVTEATPASVNDAVVRRFNAGLWANTVHGQAGNGTFYPARLLSSAAVVYYSNCGDDTCIHPDGDGSSSHATAVAQAAIDAETHKHQYADAAPAVDDTPKPISRKPTPRGRGRRGR